MEQSLLMDKLEGIYRYHNSVSTNSTSLSGKSFSMFGPDIGNPELRGIIPRACSHIFDHIHKDNDGIEFSIKCSFLEIYKEIIRDLLNPKGVNLRVRETPSRGVWVEDLSEH